MLIAVWSLGSAAGGFWFGTRVVRTALSRQFAWLLGAVALSLMVLPAMPGPVTLGVTLAVGGATIAPALTVENALVGRLSPATMLNEAYTWMVTTSVSASALGTAVAGLVIDLAGASAAFGVAGLAAAFSALVASLPAITRADAALSSR